MERVLTSLAIFVVCATSCKPFSPARLPVPYRGAVLQVNNRGTVDLDVFALHTPNSFADDTHAIVPLTARVHLGRVVASSNAEFAVPGVFVYDKLTPVRFVIDQIDTKRAVVDQELIVAPHDTVTLTVSPI